MGPNGAEPIRMSGATQTDESPALASARWYALAVRSRCEKGVKAELDRQRVEAYLPLRHERRMWRDRIKQVEVALFPGYVFVRSTLSGRERYCVVDLPDVICVVGHSSQQVGVPIPDREIESVRLVADHAEEVEACDALGRGAKVVIGLGPLKGVEGIVVEAAGGRPSLICSISLLGRAVRTKIDRSWLLPAS